MHKYNDGLLTHLKIIVVYIFFFVYILLSNYLKLLTNLLDTFENIPISLFELVKLVHMIQRIFPTNSPTFIDLTDDDPSQPTPRPAPWKLSLQRRPLAAPSRYVKSPWQDAPADGGHEPPRKRQRVEDGLSLVNGGKDSEISGNERAVARQSLVRTESGFDLECLASNV
jgi:hypothetical protein